MMFWLFSILGVAAAFNNPPGVDIWCGKAYYPTNASFEPGGWLDSPALSTVPLLDLKVRPRMSLYTASDEKGSFIIDAGISYINGEPLGSDTVTGELGPQSLEISISIEGSQLTVHHTVPLNSSSTEVEFPLLHLPPSLRVVQYGGSVTKVDSLYGGLSVQNQTNPSVWTPLLPYSYYVSWDGWLEKSLDNVQKFKDDGYNIIHIVPNAGLANEAFNFTELSLFLDKMDEVGLWLMYDMRWTYKNLTSVREQVDILKDHKSMLLWYTGDEPDGQGDPLNATRITYDLLKSIDPYHPVSLCLNCYNFYFEEYSSGADIILSDVYPIAVNTSWSTVYETPCNTTYGCCGCDDCEGSVEDISVRLDKFAEYQTWLGASPKPFWGVPMAFGNETFWTRYPTAAEEVTMTMLSLNHNAKGIVMWDWPTTTELANVTSALSRVLAGDEVTGFLLGSPTVSLQAKGHSKMDVAGWTLGDRMLVSILSLQTPSWSSSVTVELPERAQSVTQVLWGSGEWKLVDGHLVKKGGNGLETDLVVVELASR
ncbi:uncharacterized protein N7503_005380 [Penicillium pulvis]|uniref:uncharacterized protein n=1 Tax=Penicillium pulvis TaxID=1562058 RepID=UPI0025483780|nr:uncharacterized protein N7503_005380 [Penicillium pulvis]KAJ5802930.1 hypothetical protein N7503_005380 [Penicillium pulvis]